MSQCKHAILIGGSEFPDANGSLSVLPSAGQDVRAMERVLSDPQIGGFDNVQVVLDLPHYEILLRINKVMRKAEREDQILIYYSGHGLLDSDARLHFATVDTQTDLIHSTAVAMATITTLFRETRCRRIAIILDCCFSAAAIDALDSQQLFSENFETARGAIGKGYAVCIIAATAASEQAFAPSEEGESYFTASMLDAIRTGKADSNNDGIITMQELYEHTHQHLSAFGQSPPVFFEQGTIGSLAIANTPTSINWEENVKRIQKSLQEERLALGASHEDIFNRALEILSQTEKEIRCENEALFTLLRDWSHGKLSFEEMANQWYQFDNTRLVATNKSGETSSASKHWDLIHQCRRPIHDLVCPSYILDRNYHFLDWNPLFDELVAKPTGLLRFSHVEEFILKLENHRDVIERSQRKFSDDEFPMVDFEDLIFLSQKYGLILFKKIAAQIPSRDGGLLAWSVNLNIVQAEHADDMWRDLRHRLNSEVNWSIYAKLYDRMLLCFDSYNELVRKIAGLMGEAKVIADLGAGTGNMINELLRRSPDREILALESNEEMIERLREKLYRTYKKELPQVTVFKGDLITSLRNLEENVLDGAVMMNVLYSIPDRARCLREIYRVLKPGGVLVYSTSTEETNIDRLFEAIKKNLKEKGVLKELRPVADMAYERNVAMLGDILRDSPEDVVNYATQAGFNVSSDVDIFPGQYEGAVSIIRASKPKILSDDMLEQSGSSQHICQRGESSPIPSVVSNTGADSAPVTTISNTAVYTRIFISYAHEDCEWRDLIMKYLKPAEDDGIIRIWADTHIDSGEPWERTIESNINQASLALLLVTPSYLASNFIRCTEMPWLLEQHDSGLMRIVPVSVERCLINNARYKYPDPDDGPNHIVLGDLQFENYCNKPLAELEKSKQNLFVDQLSQNLLKRASA